MNYIVGVILLTAGLATLFWSKSISNSFIKFSSHRYSRTFGSLAHSLGWDDPKNRFMIFLHRLLVIMLGILLLILAFHSFFGTIYTGSAVPPTDSLLQVQN
jgi:hypothetical protein